MDKELPIFLCSHLVLWNFHLEAKEKSKKKGPKEKQNLTMSLSSLPLQWLSIVLRTNSTPPQPRSVSELWHYHCHQLCSLNKHPCVGSQISRSESSHVWLASLFRIKMVARLCLEALRKIHFQALWVESCLPSSLSQIQNLGM